VPFIDVSATEDGKNIYVSVINRKEKKEEVKIEIEKKVKTEGEVFILTGKNPTAINTHEKEEVKIEKENYNKFSEKFNFTFLPNSATILKLEKNE